jgi:O-methyltransferase involved in polyketide biosynthesis
VKRLTSTFQYKQDDRTAKIVGALLTYLPDEVVNEMLEIIRREERKDAMADAAKEDWEERQREGDSK